MKHVKRLLQGAAAAGAVSLALGSTTMGCLNRPIDTVNPRTTSTVVERLQQNGVDKIDLLLDIDNSISMADKQQILAAAVPDLVNRLITPNCEDADGNATGNIVDASGKCPDGEKPEFPPIRNINIGVISSSLGDLTSGACGNASIINPDDKGRLLTRTKTGTPPADFQGKGFLGWDPDNNRGGQTDPAALIGDLTEMVIGVDQVGCGYEMQLEAALRFLADPDPYDSLAQVDSSHIKEVGTDMVVLQQRKDFLRPDSLLAILILSDENDCSIAVGPNEQGFIALKAPFYRATSECADDPNSDCCTSCGLGHSGCDVGGNCTGPGGAKYQGLEEDSQNLKCYRQKQRYGVDFLYPTSRYVNAFSNFKIDSTKKDFSGDAEDNPIFQDLQGSGGSIRSSDLVFVAGIVGVPWQAIARQNDAGTPDLSLGFKTFDELQDDLDYLIGDPDGHVDPGEPFMIESTEPRSGTSMLTGASLPGNNLINGNDWTIYDPGVAGDGPDDLEYACIFDLATPVTGTTDCTDCTTAACDNPLCNNTSQERAKAYPGLRELAVLRGMGSQGIFASICPAEPVNQGSPIYGYRPAVNTIVDRLKEQLGGQCLPRKLTKNKSGGVDCLVIEATVASGDCTCGAGREAILETNDDGTPNPAFNAVNAAKESDFANDAWNCFCEIIQLPANPDDPNAGPQHECQYTEDPDASTQGDGWCYIDAAPDNQVGNPALVAGCPPTEQRLVRFVGKGEPKTGATVFVTCTGD